MNYAVHKISLDIHKPESQVVINMKQTDTGRKVKISLTEDGRPYDITSDCSAVFKAKTIDGNDISCDCKIESNAIIYTVSAQITSSIGENKCEIMLYNENGLLITSPAFSILVYGKVNAHGSVLNPDSEASAKLLETLKKMVAKVIDETLGVATSELSNLISKIHSHLNEEVLDKFSENENGELLYDGKPIKAGRSYKTFVCEQSDTFIATSPSCTGVIVYLVNVDDDMINAEIKAVRVEFSDKTIDIQEIGDAESQVPAVNMNKIFYSNTMGGYRIFAIDCRDYNDDIKNIQDSIFNSIEIDYYID